MMNYEKNIIKKKNDFLTINDKSKLIKIKFDDILYTTSYLTNENMAYREQITDMHKRYRAYFSLESNLKLDNYVTLEELESKAGRTIEEMLNDKYVKVLTKYEYTYGK